MRFLDEIGDILDKLLLVDAIRNLRDDNLIVLVAALNLGLSTHHNTSTTGGISIANALQTIDIRSRGEVRSRNILHQSVEVDVGIVNICAAAIDNLVEVMGRNVCGHAHGNTVASVDQEVRNLRRHHRRLLECVVEVVHHVDGILLNIVHDVLTHLRQAALGITHGSRRVTVDGTEVTLTVDEGVTHIPALAHTDECTVD